MKRFFKDVRSISEKRDWGLLAEYISKRGLIAFLILLLAPWWVVAAACILAEMLWRYVLHPPLNLAMWPPGRTLDLHKKWYRGLAAKYKSRHMEQS